jgi:hypothetical protein
MTTMARSPLSSLVQSALEAIGVCPTGHVDDRERQAPSEAIEQLAGGLLVGMGFKEISEDVDLNGVALLGAASIVGLRAIEIVEPGLHRLESALYALEDLLRRSAPVKV